MGLSKVSIEEMEEFIEIQKEITLEALLKDHKYFLEGILDIFCKYFSFKIAYIGLSTGYGILYNNGKISEMLINSQKIFLKIFSNESEEFKNKIHKTLTNKKCIVKEKNICKNNSIKINNCYYSPILFNENIVAQFFFLNFEGGRFKNEYKILELIVDFIGPIIIKKLEKANEQKMNTQLHDQLSNFKKTEFLQALTKYIGHKFNNILTSIAGSAELLKMENDDPDSDIIKTLDVILNGVQDGAQLTKELFSLTGSTIPNPEIININDEIKHLKDGLINDTSKNIKIKIHNTFSSSFTLKGDKNQIITAFKSILTKSILDANENSSIIIEFNKIPLNEPNIRTFIDLDPGDYITITITNEGEGHTESEIGSIFDPFSIMKNVDFNMDLNLALAHRSILSHNGNIFVESKLNVGTSFKIFLPYFEPKTVVSTTITPTTIKKGYTILFADDELGLRELSKKMLEKLGYRVLIAADGQEAVRIYQQQKNFIDMVLIDFIMPIMDGKEAFIEMKKINPDVKVIFISGYLMEEQKEDVMKLGALGYIQKPFNFSQLVHQIEKSAI